MIPIKDTSFVAYSNHTMSEAWSDRTCFKEIVGGWREESHYLRHRRRGTRTALYSRRGWAFSRRADFHSWPWEAHTSKLCLGFCLASGSGQQKTQIRDQDTGQTPGFQKSHWTFSRYLDDILTWKLVHIIVPKYVLCWLKISHATLKCMPLYHPTCDLDRGYVRKRNNICHKPRTLISRYRLINKQWH